VARQIANPQILGLIQERKFAHFCGVPARKSQIRKFVMINPEISQVSQSANPHISKVKTVPKAKSRL
jgi:hypothetical protein